MGIRRTKEQREAYRAMNENLRLLNKEITEAQKELMKFRRQSKRAIAQKQRNGILAEAIKRMRAKGASDREIRQVLPGISEFVKILYKARGKQASSKPENPDLAPAVEEEALGFLLSEIERQEVQWLWEKRLPLGKITILDGDPGMGKSLLAITLAACVSTGSPMPDGTPGKPGGVVLIAPEDGAGDTLRPRLEAAGGDPSHVLLLNMVEGLDAKKMEVVDRPFSLSHDLEILEEAIKCTNAVLVIMDPLMAVLGHSVDSSRDQDIREVFTPLSQLAERTGCAVLIIRHLNKGASEKALYRGAGSIGIIAAARVGLLVAHQPRVLPKLSN